MSCSLLQENQGKAGVDDPRERGGIFGVVLEEKRRRNKKKKRKERRGKKRGSGNLRSEGEIKV